MNSHINEISFQNEVVNSVTLQAESPSNFLDFSRKIEGDSTIIME